MTIIYLIANNAKQNRYINDKNNDSLEYRMSKVNLSYDGINNAISISKMDEFKNIDYIYSSDYVSCVEAANILADVNNIYVNVDKLFTQRKIGVNKLTEIPNYYEEIHFKDINYRLDKGESQLDIINRMFKGIDKILVKHKNKRIVIFTHKICIIYLLRRWCLIKYKDNFIYENKIIFDGKNRNLLIFKLEFDKNKLINISYIEK